MITELFKKRLSAFYSSWRTHKELWGNSDIVVFSTPAQASNLRSSRVFLWLFGEDLADTTAVFTPSSIFFLCTQKSFSRLRILGGYATEVMKIPVSVELKPRNDEGLYKLDGIIRSMRLSLNSGKSLFAADLSCPLTVGCIDNEMPKSKLLLNCVNGFEYFAKYRIASVNSGVEKLIAQGDLGTAGVSDSRIYKKDSFLGDNIQFNRGVKRTLEDRIDARDKAKVPLSGSLGKLEKSNLCSLIKLNDDEEMILDKSGKFEKANKPSLVVDQRENTQPMMVGETSYESYRVKKGVGMQCYDEGNLLSLDESREFKQQCINKLETEKDGLMKDEKAARKGLSVPEQRLPLFYSSWRNYKKDLWGESDVLVVTTLPSGSLATMRHPVSSSFFKWLLGHDFPDTTAVFMDQAIYFICPIESYAELCSLGLYMTTAAQVSVSVQQKVKAGDESELINLTLYALRTHQANDHPIIIGYIDGEAPNSKVLDRCVAKLEERRFQTVNVISGFVKLLNEGGELESLQSQSLDTPEDKVIENLADNYQQVMSLSNCNNAETSIMPSNEQQKDEPLQEKHENKNELHKSELEEVNGKIGNLPSKFAEMNIVVEGEQYHHSTPATENVTESKLVAEEGNAEQVVVAEKEQDSQSSNARDDVIENACNQSKESVVSDDDWEIIERHHEEQEPDLANNSRWRRYL